MRILGSQVAVKQIKKSEALQEWMGCIKREMTLTPGLKHPNIVETLAVYEDGSTISFVMQLAKHGDLLDVGVRYGTFFQQVGHRVSSRLLERLVGCFS